MAGAADHHKMHGLRLRLSEKNGPHKAAKILKKMSKNKAEKNTRRLRKKS